MNDQRKENGSRDDRNLDWKTVALGASTLIIVLLSALVTVAQSNLKEGITDNKDDINQIQQGYVTKEILDLTLKPLVKNQEEMQRSQREIQESIKRNEDNTYRILKEIEKQRSQ